MLAAVSMDADSNELSLTFNHALATQAIAANQLIVTASPSSAGVWKNTGPGSIGGTNLAVPMTLTSGTGSGTTGTFTTSGSPTVTDTSAQSLVPPTTAGVVITH